MKIYELLGFQSERSEIEWGLRKLQRGKHTFTKSTLEKSPASRPALRESVVASMRSG
jgi:hypothetical protein